jgi:hypothetical protein
LNIQLRGDAVVDALMITYQSGAVQQQLKYGGGGGKLSALLTLLPGQFVNHVEGRVGTSGQPGTPVVTHVKLTISDGRGVEIGNFGGDAFDWQVPSDSFVLGFAGRSGDYLDQIQVVYATINAAKWQ